MRMNMEEYKVENEFGMSEYPTLGEFLAGVAFVVEVILMFWVSMVAFG